MLLLSVNLHAFELPCSKHLGRAVAIAWIYELIAQGSLGFHVGGRPWLRLLVVGKGKGADKGKGKGKPAAPLDGSGCWNCGGQHFSTECPKANKGGTASAGSIHVLCKLKEHQAGDTGTSCSRGCRCDRPSGELESPNPFKVLESEDERPPTRMDSEEEAPNDKEDNNCGSEDDDIGDDLPKLGTYKLAMRETLLNEVKDWNTKVSRKNEKQRRKKGKRFCDEYQSKGEKTSSKMVEATANTSPASRSAKQRGKVAYTARPRKPGGEDETVSGREDQKLQGLLQLALLQVCMIFLF